MRWLKILISMIVAAPQGRSQKLISECRPGPPPGTPSSILTLLKRRPEHAYCLFCYCVSFKFRIVSLGGQTDLPTFYRMVKSKAIF